MTNSDARQWIVAWFEGHAAGAESVETHTGENYFDQGWLDSLSFVTFVADLEAHFDIQFSIDEFQNRSFATIDGVASIVDERRRERR